MLPIGGPGNAQTPRQQGGQLVARIGREPRFKQVPVALLEVSIEVISAVLNAVLNARGRTASMLVWAAAASRYDAAATPSTGQDTLADFFARRLRGEVTDDRGEHAVFQ